jgi:branched-chain amino acid aminotransferase
MYINLDGKIWTSTSAVIQADSRGLRYGEGIFETMRLEAGRIPLLDLHMDRFFGGLELLGLNFPTGFTRNALADQFTELWKLNGQHASARIRLTAFGGEGIALSDSDSAPHYLIQAFPLSVNFLSAYTDLKIGLYPESRKSMDRLSQLKSNNYLLFVQAARYAHSMQWDDALILNWRERVCESTIANLFCFKDGALYTPALSEGCVAGVMRRHVINVAWESSLSPVETEISIEFLEGADEVFLTNAVRGICPVGRFGSKEYGHKDTQNLQKILNIFEY